MGVGKDKNFQERKVKWEGKEWYGDGKKKVELHIRMTKSWIGDLVKEDGTI